MSTSKKLTKRFVESVNPHKENELLLWDSELKGFGIRVFPTGRRTYFVQYRNQFGNTRRKKIGVHGSITAEQAREEAKIILGDVAKGEDPSQNYQRTKTKKTIAELAIEYIEVYAKSNKKSKSLFEDKRMLDNVILKRLGAKKIEEITAHDIQHLHHGLRETPYMANRILALLSKMFNLAVQWNWISTNPIGGVNKYQEHKRDRWLNLEELNRLWTILDQYPHHLTAHIFKFLLLTGARKGEAMQSTWDQFDLKKAVWTKPSHLTKQRKKEHLPLSDKAINILQDVKKLTRDPVYVFPGRIDGQPIKELKTFWKTVLRLANLENVRIHDLRHTHASHLVSSGLSLSIVGKLLGHTQASTTQRYAHLADEPLRQAAELFSTKIGDLDTQ
jgi:integrase